jgi:hypothetical protein
MVTTKPTQSPQGASDDSVRITAQQRHDAVVGFLSTELVRQQSIVAFEKRDRTAKRRVGVAPVDMDAADMRVTAAVAVEQYISSTLAAFGFNRDFPAVQS